MMLPGDPEDYEEDDEFPFPWGPLIMMATVFIIGAIMEYFNWYPGH
jgi:hypothetical protein